MTDLTAKRATFGERAVTIQGYLRHNTKHEATVVIAYEQIAALELFRERHELNTYSNTEGEDIRLTIRYGNGDLTIHQNVEYETLTAWSPEKPRETYRMKPIDLHLVDFAGALAAKVGGP